MNKLNTSIEEYVIPLDGNNHEIGDSLCVECWGDYPRICDCGGLIHAQYYDESWDSLHILYRCDLCGDDSEE